MTAPIPAGEGPPWIDEKHMMHAGMLAGTLLNHGLEARPVYDADGLVTPIINIRDKSGYEWAVIVMPEGSTTDKKPEPKVETKPDDGT